MIKCKGGSALHPFAERHLHVAHVQLAGLREGTVHFPSGPDLIRYCLQQALAAEARGHPQLAAAAGSAQAPPVGTTEAPQGPWQSPVSPPPLPAPVARRAKLLHSWAAKVRFNLARACRAVLRRV
jgi:hypothetical protein